MLQREMSDVKTLPDELSPPMSAVSCIAARLQFVVRLPFKFLSRLKRVVSCRLLHEQISDQIRLSIVDGKLRPGGYIPSSRQLADHLGVSRNTVLLAFNRLASEGYIEATKGSHTFVSQKYAKFRRPRDTARPRVTTDKAIRRPPILFRGEAQKLVHTGRKPIFDFFVGRPCPRCFPHRTWRRLLLKRHAAAGSSLSEYPHPAGTA